MRIDSSFWSPNKEYEFSCTVTEYTKKDEGAVRGTASKYFSTATYNSDLKMIVAPSSGVAFDTDFLLESHPVGNEAVKC
jgi:sulfite reductase alpha subunit-like flavoprotein